MFLREDGWYNKYVGRAGTHKLPGIGVKPPSGIQKIAKYPMIGIMNLDTSRQKTIFIFAAICAAIFLWMPTDAHAQALGEVVTFNLEKSFDENGRTSTPATLRQIGSHSLVYVENTYYNGLSSASKNAVLNAAAALREEFDTNIYPKLSGFYGTPWEPGIDNDVRITLLLTDMEDNAGGYFDTSDEFTRQQSPESNEREMLYLNIDFYTNPTRMYSFTAHEFTHLIDFNQKRLMRSVDDEVWLNEMRADYAPTYAGYDSPYPGSNLNSRVVNFLSEPHTSVTEWQNRSEDYAAVNLLAQYLTGKYGTDVLKHSMQTSLTGIAALERGLSAVGAGVSFSDAFQNWQVANKINTSQPGLAYVYDMQALTGEALRHSGVTVSSSLSSGGEITLNRQIEDWAGQWIEFTPSGVQNNDSISISVNADVDVRAKAILKHDNGSYSVQQFSGGGQSVTLAVSNATNYAAITVVPVLMGKTAGFSVGESDGNYPPEPIRTYSVTAKRVAAGAPIITSATPSLVLEGGTVTLTGSGFTGSGLLVSVDNATVAPTVINDTTLTFTAPAHADGSVCVTVSVTSGTTQRCDLLTYGAYPDGSLLRAQGDHRVWIIKGGWRRHIVSPRVFDFYAHFGFDSVIDVPQETIDQYRLSAWVRVPLTGDTQTWRIYEINGDSSRHWITCADADNCGATWIQNGGNPDGIYTINQAEMDHYREGPVVFLQ